MKVWQLKRLKCVVRTLDYDNILDFTEEDIDLLMKALDKNKDITTLMKFLIFEQEHLDWKDRFSHLEGIEDFDIKDYISNCILNANSKEKADLILKYFDCNYDENKEILKLFKTVEEWCAYINCIDVNIEHDTFEKLKMALNLLPVQTAGENRISLIKNVISCSFGDDNDLVSRIMELSKYLVVTESNKNTIQLIYKDFFKFVDIESITEENKDYYSEWLMSLSILPSNVCKKILNIINLEVFKEADLEIQKKMKEVLVNSDNFGSLDCIYFQYLRKNTEYKTYKNKFDVKKLPSSFYLVDFVTVSDILKIGYGFDVALYGFNDEDEITSKTLSRSIPYIMYKK